MLKTFRRHLTDMTLFLCGVRGGVTLERAGLKALVAEHVPTIEPCETAVGRLFAALRQSGVEVADEDIRRIWRQAYDTTRRETHQAMEGFIHNLNTMHSRGGNQVVFSSVNYGTDFSPEGRMVIREPPRSRGWGTAKCRSSRSRFSRSRRAFRGPKRTMPQR